MDSRRSTTGDLRRIPVRKIAVYGLALGGANFGWQWKRQDEVAASIGVRVQGDGGTALLVLDFILNGSPMAQRIRLEASPCRFGGVRWLALCPNTGRRVAHLYIGRQGALSRHAYRLKFNSQREGPLDRSLRRRDKALAKLKADSPMALERPRGMHLQSYEKFMRDIAKEIAKEEEFFAVLARVRFGIEI